MKKMKKRVAVIGFMHETNTFSVLPTDLSAFQAAHLVYASDLNNHFDGTNTEVGGFLQAANEHGWEGVPIFAASASPGGYVSEDARTPIANEVVRCLINAGPLDGIFVALHGAMATQTSNAGETQFLREIRRVVGEGIPLAITLDLHANISDEMKELANIAVSYKTYPHVDLADTALQACDLLNRAISGEISPSLVIKRPPMLMGCDDGRTTDGGPMCELLASASRRADAEEILTISINAGFTDADVPDAGPSVIVCYDANKSDAASSYAIANALCDEI